VLCGTKYTKIGDSGAKNEDNIVIGTFKAGRISHLAFRISHFISLYNMNLKDRLERMSRLIICDTVGS
jgi:hypothetical protein